MVNRFGHLLLASAGLSLVQAQPTFERIYLSSATEKMNLIEQPSQNLVVGLAWGPGVSLLDPAGSIVQTEHYWSDAVLVQQSIRRYAINEFYFVTGYRKDSCGTSGLLNIPYTYPAIGRMDSLGNVLYMHYYQFSTDKCWNLASDLFITADKSIITWGGGGPGVQWSFFALKVDSLGGALWGKQFSGHGSFQFIKELPSGDLLAGINLDTAGAVLARMDAEGNILWCKSYIRPKGMIHDVVIESDDSFVVTGYTDSIASTNPFAPLPATFLPKLFMMKLDGEGEMQWCRGYASASNQWYTPQSSRLERTLDGNYVVLATLGYPQNNFFHRPYLMKTDQNGDTLWTRSMGANGYDHYTKDLLVASDGGYLFSGGLWGSLPDGWSGAPYIFKTDSLGHFPCWEQTHSLQVLDLFPTDSSFVLTSVDGATAYPAYVSDTIFDPINVYDACQVTQVPAHNLAKQRSMRLYPNPTPGRFTMEFPDPLLAESYYSVYDALGRLLLQRRLPTGATLEEVDLSRFGQGTYVIKVTDPEGVRHERVVVE